MGHEMGHKGSGRKKIPERYATGQRLEHQENRAKKMHDMYTNGTATGTKGEWEEDNRGQFTQWDCHTTGTQRDRDWDTRKIVA